MGQDNIKRKKKRINFPCEAKIRIVGEDKDINVNIKDINTSGARVIIGGRHIKVDTPLEIKINISGRCIQCRGRSVWILALRPGFGNINLFDMGVEFAELNPEDQVFLEEILGTTN